MHRAAAITLGTLLLVAAPFWGAPLDAAEFKKYEAEFYLGCMAFDKGNWDEVVKHMKKARELFPESNINDKREVRYKTRRPVLYRPSVYVGVALCKCKEPCPQGVQEWIDLYGRMRPSVNYDAVLAGCENLIIDRCQPVCRNLVQLLKQSLGYAASQQLPWLMPEDVVPALSLAETPSSD